MRERNPHWDRGECLPFAEVGEMSSFALINDPGLEVDFDRPELVKMGGGGTCAATHSASDMSFSVRGLVDPSDG